ncbi:MAG: class I SAM-dependent methyltransferase [Hyphomicrobium sp.]
MKYDHYTKGADWRRRLHVWSQLSLFQKLLRRMEFESALEIGPGHGEFASFCRQRQVRYKAVEEHPAIASALARQGYDVIVSDIGTLTQHLGTFDLIVMSHVLEHLGSYHDAARALKSLMAMLKPAGHIVLLFPDVQWSPAPFYNDYTHTFPTTIRAVRTLCEDIGGSCVRVGHYVGPWLRPWKLIWLVHRIMPTWILPHTWGAELDSMLMINAYCIARVSNRQSFAQARSQCEASQHAAVPRSRANQPETERGRVPEAIDVQ